MSPPEPLTAPCPSTTSGMDVPGLAATIVGFSGVVGRGRRLIAVAVVACLAVAVVYLLGARPLYAATARLLILQRGGHPLSVSTEDLDQSHARFETFLPTQMAILQSPGVVGRAIDLVGARNLPTLQGALPSGTTAELAKFAVKNYLRVTRPDRTALIVSVEYDAGTPAEAVRMVDAVVASYETFLGENLQSTNSEVVSLIARARDELSRELDETQAKYLEFQREHPVALDDGVSHTLTNSRLVELDRAANESMVRAIRLKTQLESGRKLAREGVEVWSIAYALSQIGGDPGSGLIPRPSDAPGGSWDHLRRLAQEERDLTERFGPEYSKVKSVREQIARLQGTGGDVAGGAAGRGADQLLTSIQRSLESVETMRADIAAQTEGILNQAKKAAGELSAGRGLRDNLERQKALFATVVDQLKKAQLGGDFNAMHSQTIEPTNASARPVYPRASVTLAMALLTGCVLGVTAAFVADGLDSRVHSAEELRTLLGVRVLGTVPRLTEAQLAATGEPGSVCHVSPHSPLAEAYTGVRTGVEFLRRGGPSRVLLVTSAVAGEGKSTTAANLAISLARAGRTVLLVDANLRRPTLHRVLGLRRDTGLIHILKGLLPWHRVVQRTAVPNLDFASSGPYGETYADLLMSERLHEFLDEARGSYDVVVVDSPPVLSVTDALILGAQADGIILVARVSVVRRSEAARVVEALRSADAPVVGAVINGSEGDRLEPLRRVLGRRGGRGRGAAPAALPPNGRAEVVRSQ